MARGISVHVKRTDAIRMVGEAIRAHREQFEKDRIAYREAVVAGKVSAQAWLAQTSRKVGKATDAKALRDLMELPSWQTKSEWFPYPPQLNLCPLKQQLIMLRAESREVIPINSNHTLWDVLQGKCGFEGGK